MIALKIDAKCEGKLTSTLFYFILPWNQMNNTINKAFYTCSTKSLFLRYKKVYKKAAKLGSFLQCPLQVFLGF